MLLNPGEEMGAAIPGFFPSVKRMHSPIPFIGITLRVETGGIMSDIKDILSHGDKTLDEVSELLEMTPRDVISSIIERERTIKPPPPGPGPEKPPKVPEDERDDEQLADYFLNRLMKESLSIAALNNKYKVKDKERVERILENLVKKGKLTKRESRNKKGRYVYESVEKEE
jgi:hypothetical protein